MDIRDLVRTHYGAADLTTAILRALAGAGVDVRSLTVHDLAAVDQLHAGFADATEHVLTALDLDVTSRLLDVGSGIGGPARMAAATRSCRVTGVDLTPEFVATADALTARVGFADLVRFQVAPADELPFGDATFDRAMMIHVGMNVPDKRAVFAEIRRVLVDGGVFVLYEQLRTAEGFLPFPQPWADDEDGSFVETAEAYVEHLTGAGFTVERTENRRKAVAAGPPSGPPGGLGPGVVFGAPFMRRIRNNNGATAAGLLAPVLVVARAA